MTLLWLVTAASLATAILAWRAARRTARRVDQLSELYWALKYQHGELRVQLQRLQSGAGAEDAETRGAPAAANPADRARDSFVPLSSLRR
jgi:hypothetical protein